MAECKILLLQLQFIIFSLKKKKKNSLMLSLTDLQKLNPLPRSWESKRASLGNEEDLGNTMGSESQINNWLERGFQ